MQLRSKLTKMITMNDVLNIWYETHLVGKIWHDNTGRIGFCYEKEWVNHGFAISQQLPLSTKEYPENQGKAHLFFANLLPEAGARMHIVRDLKITDSDFELLKAIGGECAGALSILPIAKTPEKKAVYKKLDDKSLTTLLVRKGNSNKLFSEYERPRLSLAGAQDKCAILFQENEYSIPLNSSPSTHILKFELSDYRHIPAYEYFLTKLAKKIKLPVVKCDLKTHGNHYFLVIKRYDRKIEKNGSIKRLHQEDFCQATGIAYHKKYQIDGGPSFKNCYQLIQKISTNPIIDAENLIKWQIFNVLTGNSDGHAKNLSFIYDEKQKISLAPFYDLVCTRAIARIDHKLAMAIDGEFDPGQVNLKHWVNLAEQCQIRESYLLNLLANIAEALSSKLEETTEEFSQIHGNYPAIQRVQQIIKRQCRKTMNQLK